MSKIVVFGDLHFRDTEPYYSCCRQFIDWFESTEENNSDNIGFFLGDIFHKPKNSGQTNDLVVEFFLRKLRFKKIYILRGNHDFSKREGDALQIFDSIENIEIIRFPEELEIEDVPVLCLPYLYPFQVEKKSMKDLYGDSSFYDRFELDHRYIFGHFGEETAGTYGVEVTLPKELKGTRIFGHIHSQMNSVYLGTPYRTRYDEKNRKKFELLSIDTSTGNSERIEIPDLLQYDTITFGDDVKDSEVLTIYDIENAPSIEDAYEKYNFLYIREVRKKFQKQERTVSETELVDNLSLKDLFAEYATINKVSNDVQELILEELS